jgi:hypothetical protein
MRWVMRFVMWQQAFLLTSFVVLLVLFVIATYRITTGVKSLRATLIRLVALVIVGSVVWVCLGVMLLIIARYGMADVGVRYAVVRETYDSTFGFPFTISYWEFLRSTVEDRRVLQYLIAATIPFILLLLSGLVVVVDRMLAGGSLAIQRHPRAFGDLLVAVALVVLTVQMWPQPLRNPDMPSVPIPEGAIGVHYAYTNDSPRWPMTTFAAEGLSASQVLNYYKDALVVDKWQLEWGQAYAQSQSEHTSVFSKDHKFLELNVSDTGYGRYTRLILREATPAEFAQFAELRNPVPTSIPPPVPTYVPR